MNEAFKAAVWFCAGVLACLVFLAWPIAAREDDALGIVSLRALGCDPYLDRGALHSGCQQVRHIKVQTWK